MKRPYLLISGAWLVHAAAWFLPVVKYGVTLPKGLPGWEAFRVACCAIWPCEGMRFGPWYATILSGASAITTVMFLLGLPCILWGGSRSVQRVSAWAAAGAFILNSHWYVLFGSDRSDLRIGYFFWWWSFALVAIGFFDLAGRSQPRTIQVNPQRATIDVQPRGPEQLRSQGPAFD